MLPSNLIFIIEVWEMEMDKQKKGKRAAYRLGPSYYTITLKNVNFLAIDLYIKREWDFYNPVKSDWQI